MVIFMLAVFKWDEEDDFEIAMLLIEGSEMINRAFTCENFRKAVRTWLPFLDKKGFLDPIAVDGDVYEDQHT